MKPHRTYFRQSLALIACMGSLLMLPMAESLSISRGKVSAQQPTPQLSPQQIKQLAQSITVKVSSGNNGGSGILLKQNGGVYTVLTNRHVLEPGKPIKLQTSDGKTYPGNVVQGVDFQGKDLIQLQFSSKEKYKVAELGNLATVAINETIYAGGFPFETNPSQTQGFVLTTGQVLLIPQRALKEGYQIGYDNDIRKGMSGGPILNRYGQLIGINGIHAHPLWGNPYVYEDGSNPTEAKRDLMSRYSWGIPIQTATSLASKGDSTVSKVPVSKLPPIANEVNNIAEKITVRIDVPNFPECSGSGVIIAKKQNTYTVLTAEHTTRTVIDEEGRIECDRATLSLVTHDGRKYPIQVNDNSVKKALDSDLAVIEFTSNQTYDVATLADYELGKNLGFIFISGWTGSKNNSNTPQRLFTAGELLTKLLGYAVAKDSLSMTYGYSMFYTNKTYQGMSGGPVLDTRGHVIGIHGKADQEKIKDKAGRNRFIPLGFSLGVPTSKFVSWAQQVGMASVLRVETSVPPALTNKEQNGIRKALLQVRKPSDDADAIDWLNYGWQYFFSGGNTSETIKAIDRAIELKPDFYQAWYLRGLININDKESLQYFKKATDIQREFTPARRLRCIGLLIFFKRYQEALSCFEQLAEIDPNDIGAQTFRSGLLLKQKRFSEAFDIADKVIKRNPNGMAYFARGSARMHMKDLKGALADVNEAVDLEPEKTDYLKKRAEIRIKLKDYKGAITDLNKLLSLKEDTDAITLRALVRFEQKDYQSALADLNKLLSFNPKDTDAIKYRAGVRFAQKDYKNALADLNKVVRLKPEDSDAYYYRGETLAQMKNYQGARKDFQIAANLYKKEGKKSEYQKALAELKKLQ